LISQGVAYLWNLENNQVYPLTSNANVQGISFKPDGNLLVATTTENDNQTVSLWNYNFSQFLLVGNFKVEMSVENVVISPDGESFVITFGGGRSVGAASQLWSVGKDTPERLGQVVEFNYSPDGQKLAIADFDSTIRLLTGSGYELVELKGHQGLVSSSSFSPDGKQLLTVGNDNTIRLWNIEEDDLQLSQSQELPNLVQTLSFSSDGKQVATLENGEIYLRDLSSGQQLKKFPRQYNPESKLLFQPQGKQLAIVEPNAIHLLDLSSGQESPLPGQYESANSLSFSPNGRKLAIFEGTSEPDAPKTLRVLDLESKQEQKFDRDKGPIQSAIWKSDAKGDQLLVVMADVMSTYASVEIWDVFSRQQLASLRLGRGSLRNINDISFNNKFSRH
jgi:WD40 repeat protein